MLLRMPDTADSVKQKDSAMTVWKMLHYFFEIYNANQHFPNLCVARTFFAHKNLNNPGNRVSGNPVLD